MNLLTKQFGIDYLQIRAIFRIKKLILIKRPLMGLSNTTQKNKFNAIILQLCLYFFLGLPASAGLLFESVVSGLTLSYTVIMMVLGISFISHMTAVLLDTTENQILFPRPVSGRTILLARIFHLGYYTSALTLSCGFATMLAIGYKHGVVAVVLFLVSLILFMFFLIVVAQTFSLLALNYIDPKKVKSMILGLLVFIMAIIVLAFNFFLDTFLGQLNYADFISTNIVGSWMYFYPPSWMAGLMGVYLEETENIKTALALLAVLVPLLGLFLGIYFLGKRFTKILSKIGADSSEKGYSITKTKKLFRTKLSDFINRSDTEKAIYALVAKLMKTDMVFKLQAYPPLGMILAFIVWFVYDNYNDSLQNIAGSGYFFVFIYMTTSFMATTVTTLQYSSQFRAAWVYQVLPVTKPGEVLSALLKAFIYRFILPLNILVTTLCVFIWGLELLADTLFAGAVSILACIWQCGRMKSVFPFSRDQETQTSGKKILLDQFLIILPILAIAGMHFFLKLKIGYLGVISGDMLAGLAALLFYRKLKQLRWYDLKVNNPEHISWQSKKTDNPK